MTEEQKWSDMVPLKEIQALIFQEYIKNGYKKEWTDYRPGVQKKIDIGELGLVGTEISEAMEEVRSKNTNVTSGEPPGRVVAWLVEVKT